MLVLTPENFAQVRAAYGDDYLVDHGLARFVPCECCGGSGEVIESVPCSRWSDPTDAHAAFQCPECEGGGVLFAMTEPITIDDLKQQENGDNG